MKISTVSAAPQETVLVAGAGGRRLWGTGHCSSCILVPFLLLTAGGCAAKRAALRPDDASSSVQTRVPAAESIGIRFGREAHPAPPILLPLTEADKAGARTLAAPGMGLLMLIEVNFSVSPPPREPADREEIVEVP